MTAPNDTRVPDDGSGGNKKLPRSIRMGFLPVGDEDSDRTIECHVIEGEIRLVTARGVVKALTGKDHGNVGEYLSAQVIKPYVDRYLPAGEIIKFQIDGKPPRFGHGYSAKQVTGIFRAYMAALLEGASLSARQIEMARRASRFVSACADIGLEELIDKATGYDRVRADDDAIIRFESYVRDPDDQREWEALFPEEFWHELARLENREYVPPFRPPHWGTFVMEHVYVQLPADVRAELKRRSPHPSHGDNLHQWLTERARKFIADTIQQVLGMMKGFATVADFKNHFGYAFQGKMLQLAFGERGIRRPTRLLAARRLRRPDQKKA